MGQEFHVLRCFSCQSFQVHQVKKANRWSCKLCGEKQSLLKEFGRGSAADCRRHVQKLNAMRGAVMEEQEHHTWSLWEQKQQQQEEEQRNKQVGQAQVGQAQVEQAQVEQAQVEQAQVEQAQVGQAQVEQAQVGQAQVSRWSKYLDTPEEAEPQDEALSEENPLLNGKQLDGNKMADRKRKRAKEAGPEDGYTPEQLNCLKPQTLSATTTCSPAPCSPATRWSHFLRPDCRGEEEEEPPAVCGRTLSLGGPHPLLPVSSMFESGEEFNFDDDFLTQV